MSCKAQALGKCISERAKLQKFTEFLGKLPISRKTVHFAIRVTAVKSRNRLGLAYLAPKSHQKYPVIIFCTYLLHNIIYSITTTDTLSAYMYRFF